jgi:hypothetical protein
MALDLTASESRWISYIENHVAPIIGARSAAVVAWWALKEGILDLPNPWRHNLCSRGGGDVRVGDLETCPGAAWQVGMSGIQPNNVSLASVEAAATKLYSGRSIPSILRSIADEAGVDEGIAQVVQAATGDLRKAWLLRDPAIGFYLQAPFVEKGCITGSYSWCYGTWDTARRFASNPARVQEVVSELQSRFSSASSGTTTLGILLALGTIGYLGYHAFLKKGARR